MSKAAPLVPSRSATRQASAGVWCMCETVAMSTAPSWSPLMPAAARALPAACTDISSTVSSSVAQRRLSMPERVRIHSSEESIQVQTSSLVTTRLGV